MPRPSQQLWTFRNSGGVVTVCGDVDIATSDRFAAVLHSVFDEADRRCPLGEAHVDLAGTGFFGLRGASVLVEAVGCRPPGRGLVVHHPPHPLVRIVGLSWGAVADLRFDPEPGERRPFVVAPAVPTGMLG